MDDLDVFFKTSKKKSHDPVHPLDQAPNKRRKGCQDKDKSTGKKTDKPEKGNKPSSNISSKAKASKKPSNKPGKAARASAVAAAPAAAPPALKDRNIPVAAFQRRLSQHAEVFDVVADAVVPQGPVVSTLSEEHSKAIGVSYLFVSM